MRRARDLFPRVVDPAALDAAARTFVRGKRRRADVAAFLFRREATLAGLATRLQEQRWLPEGFERVRVYDPKPRLIARASVEDRIVHASVGAVLEPLLLRTATPDNFACRTGFGTERARLHLLRGLAEHRFVVHLDIRAYFPSIRLDIVRGLLGARIPDAAFLELLDHILDAGAGLYDDRADRSFLGFGAGEVPFGEGLPVGALTSQLLATHLYLEGLDHFVKRTLKVPLYARYVDDLFLFGDSRSALLNVRSAVGEWLGAARDLRLKHPEAPVLSCRGHLDALGARLRRGAVHPHPGALRRLGATAWLSARPGHPTAHEEERLTGLVAFLTGGP